jgi:hypothetical protein
VGDSSKSQSSTKGQSFRPERKTSIQRGQIDSKVFPVWAGKLGRLTKTKETFAASVWNFRIARDNSRKRCLMNNGTPRWIRLIRVDSSLALACRLILSAAFLWAAVDSILHYQKIVMGMGAYGSFARHNADLAVPIILTAEAVIALAMWIRYLAATASLMAATLLFSIGAFRLESRFVPICGSWYALFWGPRQDSSLILVGVCVLLSLIIWQDTQVRLVSASDKNLQESEGLLHRGQEATLGAEGR